MRRNTMSEREFLKRLIINPFNHFKNENIQTNQTDIRSVLPIPGYTRGYELVTIRPDDFFRIFVYLNIGRSDTLSPFQLKVTGEDFENALGDEIFVATGSIDSGHHLYGGYPFQWLEFELDQTPAITDVDRMPFFLTNGGFLLLAQPSEET